MSLLNYLNAISHIRREIKIQKQYNKDFLIPYLDELENKYHGKFHDEQRKKILNYYGLFITSFLCSSYKKLYGKTLSLPERKRATLFGILTPVGDDLFDIDKLSNEEIRRLTFAPGDFNATTFSSHVAREIQSFLLSDVHHRDEYLEAAKNVLDIQVETLRQTERGIPAAEIERITYTKGAVSVIIYHYTLTEKPTAEMLDALFYIGSLFQLGNDIFDLFKDVRDNIFTLINTCDNYQSLRNKFLERVREQNKRIMQLPYPEKNKREFCITMNTINARSLVAIDKFIRQQKREKSKINWWQKERKDMIVDMEKLPNMLRWLAYIHRLPKLK